MTRYTTPGMVHDLPGAPPGAVVTTSDPSAVQSPGERARAMYPNTVGMRDGDTAEPVPGSAPPPLSPEAAAFEIPLPEGFQADPAQLDEFKQVAVANKLAPEAASAMVKLHAKALAAQRAQLDADIAGWAEKSRALPAWQDPQRPAALEAVRSVLPPASRTFLESTAFGSHPAVVEMTLALGREIMRLKGVPAGSGHFKNTPGMRD